ncbi:unnamed protein product, partial [Discosporangium mesarthrocarpum]
SPSPSRSPSPPPPIQNLTPEQESRLLGLTLSALLDRLQGEDSGQHFAEPVSEDSAPGYRRVISRPMDFSTIRRRIQGQGQGQGQGQCYGSLEELMDDVALMCRNAMRFN